MRNSIIVSQFVTDVFMQENSAKQNNYMSESVSDLEARSTELENELKKQKGDIEKGAKSMQMIWGDMFLSDSLH